MTEYEKILESESTCDFSNPEVLRQARQSIADKELEKYEFGANVTVVGQASWDTEDEYDFIKVVYVEFDDEPSESSHKVSFHVRFLKSIEVAEAYGLLVSNGSYI